MYLADIITQSLFWKLLFFGFAAIVIAAGFLGWITLENIAPKWRVIFMGIGAIILAVVIDAKVYDNKDFFLSHQTEEMDYDEAEEETELDRSFVKESQYCYLNASDIADDGNEIIPVNQIECSSSVNPAKYVAENIIDMDDNTSWQEGADGVGIGESVEIFLDTDEALPQMLRVRAGSATSERKYYENGRPRVLRFYDPDNDIATELELDDINGDQVFRMNGFDGASHFIISIEDVYEGSLYQDTVISELTFFSNNQ